MAFRAAIQLALKMQMFLLSKLLDLILALREILWKKWLTYLYFCIFFTSCNQRNEEEKTKTPYQGDRKTIFRERNGYDGCIYRQASSRTGEFMTVFWHMMSYLAHVTFSFLSFYTLQYGRTSLAQISKGNSNMGSSFGVSCWIFK